MNFLRIDGPIMNFLRMVTSYIVLQLIFIICCIPVVTIGAAIAAKYSVAMKLVKNEDDAVIRPFFKAFVKNFKQATPFWLVQMVILFLLYIDWAWILNSGIRTLPLPYVISIAVVTCVAIFITLVMFPMMTKFKMSAAQLYRGAVTFTFMNFFKLLLVLVVVVASIIGAIWYFQWLPLIAVVSSIAETVFTASILNKEFDKVEKKYREEHPEEFADEVPDDYLGEIKDFDENELSESALDSSYAASRKELNQLAIESANSPDRVREEDTEDGKKNKLSKYYKEEREKLSNLTGKQKWQYFCDYYLAMILVILVLLGAVVWYIVDYVKAEMVVITGGLVNCTQTEEGHEYVTEGFLKWAEYPNSRTAKCGNTNINFETYEEYNNRMMDMAVYAEINAGTYNYFFMNKTAMELYQEDDIFLDLSVFESYSKIPKEDIVFNEHNEPIAIILNDDIKEKCGFPKLAQIYIGFIYNTDMLTNSQFLDFLYQ